MWTFDGAADWMPLKSAQFPGFRDLFDSVAPQEIQEYAPPFLVALQEAGLVQIWTGIDRPHRARLEPAGPPAGQSAAPRRL